MERTIILSPKIDHQITIMAKEMSREMYGVLLYSPVRDFYPIDFLLVTGSGNDIYVQALPERIEILQEFLRRNHTYRYIDFHTHTRESIARFGKSLASNFSPGDMAIIRYKMDEDQEYVHVLFTPTSRKITSLGVVKGEVGNLEGYKGRSTLVQTSLETIARERRVDPSSVSSQTVPKENIKL